MTHCRLCSAPVHPFLDFGQQPLSSAFRAPGEADTFRIPLAVGICESCTMVQLLEEVPQERRSHKGYPYHSSGSTVMRAHFQDTARKFLAGPLAGPDRLFVEVGCNDGVVLDTVAEAGVRRLAFEPSGTGSGPVHPAFLDAASGREVRAGHGPAHVVYAANTLCDVPDIAGILAGADELLAPDGVLVFEDPYLGEILQRTSFDQIYDEHFWFFTAGSVRRMARRSGFDLVEVERLPVHGGQIRYTLARQGSREPSAEVAELLRSEDVAGVADLGTLRRFAATVETIRTDLVALLRSLKAEGHSVVGYGATAKSSTVINYCGIGPDLVPMVCDTTPSKQGKLTPGAGIPVRPRDAFADPYPDYALLFAWNHAEEIMAKETEFRARGGKWILYVPEVRIL